jgi:hypothetical protein
LRRPTKDIDFLGLLENRGEIINKVITAALSISVPEDGVIFDPATLFIEKTEVDDDRTGIRVKFLVPKKLNACTKNKDVKRES